jgi:RNA polymerase sigma factor (sigma-70 family)
MLLTGATSGFTDHTCYTLPRMTMMGSTTSDVQRLLNALEAGDAAAREELLARTLARIRRFASQQLHQYPGVARWEQTDDVVQGVAQRLNRALDSVRPKTPRDFFNLCGEMIRRELIDLKRKHFGPRGLGRNVVSLRPASAGSGDRAEHLHSDDTTYDPAKLARWTELHEKVAALPAELLEVFNLLWYQGLTHQEAAQVLECSARTVARRWCDARLRVQSILGGGAL